MPESPNRHFFYAIFAFHLAAAAGWWYIMPGGFPFDHPRFWVNTVFPLLLAIIFLFGMASLVFDRPVVVELLVIFIAALWIAAGLSALVVFPASRRIPFLLVITMGSLIAWRCKLGFQTRSWWQWLPIALLGGTLGAALPVSQHAPDAATRPLNVAIPIQEKETSSSTSVPASIKLHDAVTVYPGSAVVDVQCGLRLQISPMLTFESRSIDRGWTSMAKRSDRVGPSRVCRTVSLDSRRFAGRYQYDADEFLKVDADKNGDLQIEAFTELPKDVYSHLNSFTEVLVFGHSELSLSFSPCPEAIIDVTPSDYPLGRPRRFAYADSADRFLVVEASSGEKGPFREFASGILKRDDPLTITFYDRRMPVCRMTLRDWAAQRSDQLSPTAGWSVPVNAIEFSRDGDSPTSPAQIWISLAGTSIGRGWDSVGHTAGIYRNRVKLEPVDKVD